MGGHAQHRQGCGAKLDDHVAQVAAEVDKGERPGDVLEGLDLLTVHLVAAGVDLEETQEEDSSDEQPKPSKHSRSSSAARRWAGGNPRGAPYLPTLEQRPHCCSALHELRKEGRPSCPGDSKAHSSNQDDVQDRVDETGAPDGYGGRRGVLLGKKRPLGKMKIRSIRRRGYMVLPRSAT